jgi:hypothetical protein
MEERNEAPKRQHNKAKGCRRQDTSAAVTAAVTAVLRTEATFRPTSAPPKLEHQPRYRPSNDQPCPSISFGKMTSSGRFRWR